MPTASSMHRILILSLAVSGLAIGGEAAAGKELLPNGTMEDSKDGKPTNWSGTWGVDEPNPFLRLSGGAGGASATRVIPVPGCRALRLEWRVRHADVSHDSAAGKQAQIAIDFLNEAGRPVLPGPSYPTYAGSSAGWEKGSLSFFVPPGAVSLRLRPTLAGQSGGTLDIDQISLVMINPADVPEEVRTTGRVQVDGGKGQPAPLRADGGALTAGGTAVWLQGIALAEPDPAAEEAAIGRLATAIEVWKANVIRLPVDRERWLAQGDAGGAYRAMVSRLVQAAGTRGAWIIVDLRRFRAPDERDVLFWKDAAAAFKDAPAAILGLFHAPHDISWETWRSGGEVVAVPYAGPGVLPERSDRLTAYRAVGMQALLDTVRGTGAKNAVLVAGIDWASDLSGLTANELDDHGGNGIIWDVHLAPWKAGWGKVVQEQGKGRAVMLGMVEGMLSRPDSIPAERFADPWTWGPDTIGAIQTGRMHWVAGVFADGGPSAILQTTGGPAPTPYWGAFVRSALLGRTYAPRRQ